MNSSSEEVLRRAAEAVTRADALVIGAGAGMGVDSGLPDFRGDQGFWKAYPPFARRNLRFVDMANPRWFSKEPRLAWGFYGHRLGLYRTTRPHEGFSILLRWAERLRGGAFVVTSNVDGQFQRAGFGANRVWEVHGSIHHLQCLKDCGVGLFEADPIDVAVDESSFEAGLPLPACPRCGSLARPNILMFGDGGWDSERSREQQRHFEAFLTVNDGARLVIVECGAGTAISTIRRTSESLLRYPGSTLIRINPREPEVPAGQIGIASGAAAGLRELDHQMARMA